MLNKKSSAIPGGAGSAMGMSRWAAVGAAVAIVVSSKLLGESALRRPDKAAVESTHYLAQRLKTAPSQTPALIRRETAACLAERLGAGSSAELAGFIGELMLHATRRAASDRNAFIRHYRTLAESDGPVVDGWAARLPSSEKQRVSKLVEDLAGGPHALAPCVAERLRAAAPHDAPARAIVQEIPGLRGPA
jgi:hypothetical protein